MECGFSSRVYFQRLFKERTGLTPRRVAPSTVIYWLCVRLLLNVRCNFCTKVT
ncbi:AraC family transcriptional regulator [Bacteroides xylanisolvens]|nr:AraC family transcriptional regulator [Bacteroides xylanisolvens]